MSIFETSDPFASPALRRFFAKVRADVQNLSMPIRPMDRKYIYEAEQRWGHHHGDSYVLITRKSRGKRVFGISNHYRQQLFPTQYADL